MKFKVKLNQNIVVDNIVLPKSTTQCPSVRARTRPLGSESNALTMRPAEVNISSNLSGENLTKLRFLGKTVHTIIRDGSRIFFGGGAPLGNCVTDW